jgi:hypothetical protein
MRIPAGERPGVFARHHGALDSLSLFERQLRRGCAERMNGGLECLHSRQRGLDYIKRRQLAGPDRMSDLARIQVREFIVVQK